MSDPSSHHPEDLLRQVPAAPELADLAEQINLKHRSVIAHLRSALADARDAGELLHAAQRRVGYGGWEWWVEHNLPFSPRTARVYMRIALNWARLPDSVGTIESALEYLAQPRPALAAPPPLPPLEELPPPATEYEANVRRAAILVRQLHEREHADKLEAARLLADLLEAADDVPTTVADLHEELWGPLHWTWWFDDLEELIDGPQPAHTYAATSSQPIPALRRHRVDSRHHPYLGRGGRLDE